MTPYELGLHFVLEHEGGFVDHPDDPGGATNHGISLRFLRDLPDGDIDGDGDVDADDIRSLTPAVAGKFYKARFWDKVGCDRLPPAVAVAVFDAAVNCGTSRAVRWLQEACNMMGAHLLVDGVSGSKTYAATVALGRDKGEPLALLCGLRRQEYYNALAGKKEFRTFHLGWTRRVSSLLQRIIEWPSQLKKETQPCI